MLYTKPFLLHKDIEIHKKWCAILFLFLWDLNNGRMDFLQGQAMNVLEKFDAFFIPKMSFADGHGNGEKMLFLQFTKSHGLPNKSKYLWRLGTHRWSIELPCHPNLHLARAVAWMTDQTYLHLRSISRRSHTFCLIWNILSALASTTMSTLKTLEFSQSRSGVLYWI